MILTEIQIENYKQYAGEHRIELPPRGIVAVLGANGVGKTTLFEAIEWCLYNPREIENAEVPPRGGVGRTLVRVVLEDPRDGVRYVVERSLRRKIANGEVYREDQPESPIVQGSRPVTEYVNHHLIGLGHRAFVSTFFTRQKELSFFGTLRETDRRREVARLLGFETIREAQRLIGEDRTQARTEANSLRQQYEEQSANRDFASELAAAEQAITIRDTETTTSRAHLESSTDAHRLARAERDRWNELERRDAALGQAIERVGGDERAATERRDAALAALGRLDEAGRLRETLAPVAAALAAREAALTAHEAERERAQRHQELENALARAGRDGHEAKEEMQRVVSSITDASKVIAGWPWGTEDEADPLAAADRRLAAVTALDVTDARERAEQLAHCARVITERDKVQATATQYDTLFQQIQEERQRLLAGGDPAAEAESATRAWESATAAAQAAEAETRSVMAERDRLHPIAAALRQQRFGDECPTCGRPFSDTEVTVVLQTLDGRLDALVIEEQRLGQARAAARRRAGDADQARQAAASRVRDLATIEGRLREGESKIAGIQRDLDDKVRECAAALAEADLDRDPAPELIARARSHADLLDALAGTVPLLRRLRRDIEEAAAHADEARAEMDTVGPVAYDRAQHQAAREATQAARDAAARAEQIDLALAQRAGHEATRDAAAAALEELAGERRQLERDRASVGFDPSALEQAVATEIATYEAATAAARALAEAETALRDATRARDDLAREQARLAALAERADSRGREADELDRMYREFSRFDQYVAQQITPRLAEQTGDILAAITDNKYDRVAFDENYGLTIYDDEEAFPVASFSGGERDVAALSARLALSRLVGAQAAHPPNFLVLDEVFGSLDADRRAQVLSTLADLATNTAAFRQLFIISHVEDVQLAPIFDEVWRISDVDGVSRFENVTRLANAGDL